MKLRRSGLAALTWTITLSVIAGCGGSNGESGVAGDKPDSANTVDETETQPPIVAETNPKADSGTPQGTPSATDAGTPQSEAPAKEPYAPATAKPDAQAPSTPTKKLYRMNAVYSFVPIDKNKTPDKVVLLTFDDGPKDDGMISSLLDTLDKHQAKAIFFVNGYRVKRHPELLAKIADRGQTIGNHSWDHIDLKKEQKATVLKQIGDVQTIVKQVTGKSPVFFRPPFGSGNDMVKGIVRERGMLYMTWSDGSLDWDSSAKNKPDKVVANVLEQLHPGVNILMHELPWTTQALDDLLTKLESKGYGFIDPATIEMSEKPAAPSAK